MLYRHSIVVDIWVDFTLVEAELNLFSQRLGDKIVTVYYWPEKASDRYNGDWQIKSEILI